MGTEHTGFVKAPAVWNITLGGLRGALKALSHCPPLQGSRPSSRSEKMSD